MGIFSKQMKGEERSEFAWRLDWCYCSRTFLPYPNVLDNERPARSVCIDNVLLERLLRVKTIALLEHRKSAGKMFWHCGERETERCEALTVCWLYVRKKGDKRCMTVFNTSSNLTSGLCHLLQQRAIQEDKRKKSKDFNFQLQSHWEALMFALKNVLLKKKKKKKYIYIYIYIYEYI